MISVSAAIRRLKNLATLELVNIPLWMVAWCGAGFAAFALLLVQGSAYWMLKIRQLRARLARLLSTGLRRSHLARDLLASKGS